MRIRKLRGIDGIFGNEYTDGNHFKWQGIKGGFIMNGRLSKEVMIETYIIYTDCENRTS